MRQTPADVSFLDADALTHYPWRGDWCYIQAMKKFLLVALLLTVFASPAFAERHHHHHHHHHAGHPHA
jgi:hypothetical protein